MTKINELHVIFGTGPLGIAVMKELRAKGKHIRMVNRSGKGNFPAKVEVVKGDATNPNSTREICKGATVVYNCAQPSYTEWPIKFPPLQAGIIEGAAAAEAKFVSAENTYMYGEVPGPQTEDLPYAAKTRKGRARAQMAQTLMEVHKSGKVRATIGRASDFYGPGVLGSIVGDMVFYQALEGRKVTFVGNLDVPHTYTFINDFGKGLVVLGEREEALGEIWHIPSAETLTTHQFLTLVFEEAGQTPNIGVAPSIVLKAMGLFNPMVREVAEMLYEFEQPFIIDHNKYERAFGSDTTPHREGIRQTLEWFRHNPKG